VHRSSKLKFEASAPPSTAQLHAANDTLQARGDELDQLNTFLELLFAAL
jgi:hypothetical protein